MTDAAGEPTWFATLGPRLAAATRKLGEQTEFYGKSLASTGDAVRRYPGELLRLIAEMGMGTGALAVIGGTVGIIGFLTLTTGALVAVQGYDTLSNIGVEALTGFLSAFFNVRMIAPCTAGVALAATIGAGATAQLGAMRINEEIDALEVMGIRSITYLASTRIIAGVLVVIPLYAVAVLMSFFASKFGTIVHLRPVPRRLRALLLHVLASHGSVVVVFGGADDGDGCDGRAHLLRLHRDRGSRRRGGGCRSFGAVIDDRHGLCGPDDFAVRLRAVRQLQPVRVTV